MKLFIDSAKIDEIKNSISLGYVQGITTNPTLLKSAEVWNYNKNLRSFYSKLLDLFDGEVFVQIPLREFQNVLDEIEPLDRTRLIIKIPSVSNGVEIAKRIMNLGYKICATAVYTPFQAIVWASLNVEYIAVYFNRMEIAGIDAIENVKNILNSISSKSNTKVIAASIKTFEQLNSLVQIGIDHMTIGYDLLEKLIESNNSRNDADKFDEDMASVIEAFYQKRKPKI